MATLLAVQYAVHGKMSELTILTAQLRLRGGNITEPALYMRGDRHWLLTLIAMLFKAMQQEGDITEEEAIRLLRAECFHLQNTAHPMPCSNGAPA